MANVLTSVAPILYSAARIVPRELTGLIAGVNRDFDDKGVALGDVVKVGITPSLSVSASTPSQVFTVGSDRTFAQKTLTLNQAYEVNWNLTAEQERSLGNSGIAQDQLLQTVQQGFRALINQVESYAYGIARINASRAIGTAGTTPFNGELQSSANVRKIIVDNGVPEGDRTLLLDTVAGSQLRSNPNMIQFYQSNDDTVLRQGLLGSLHGFQVKESAVIAPVTKGTGTLYTSNGTGLPIGTTSIPLITGSGTVLAGDCVTFAGDTNVYVVATGIAAPGTIVINEPGLKQALPASAQAMTVGNTYTPNIAFHKSFMYLVARPAIQPSGAIAEQMVLTDSVTGLSALLLRVPGNGLASWYLKMVYDAFCPNPFAGAILRG
jgi:hypothetical protein